MKKVIDWAISLYFVAYLGTIAFDLWSAEVYVDSVIVITAIVIMAIQSKTISLQTKTILCLKEAYKSLEDLLFLVQQKTNKAVESTTIKPGDK